MRMTNTPADYQLKNAQTAETFIDQACAWLEGQAVVAAVKAAEAAEAAADANRAAAKAARLVEAFRGLGSVIDDQTTEAISVAAATLTEAAKRAEDRSGNAAAVAAAFAAAVAAAVTLGPIDTWAEIK